MDGEQFVIGFDRDGAPKLVRIVWDRTTGTFTSYPIPRGGLVQARAMASPAWDAYGQLRYAYAKRKQNEREMAEAGGGEIV